MTIPPPGPPTLLNKISSFPNCLTDSLIISSQSFSDVTSPIKIFPIPPSFSITSKVSSALSTSISQSKILAPSLAIKIAAACPVPAISPLVPAPVTIATLPSSLCPDGIFFLLEYKIYDCIFIFIDNLININFIFFIYNDPMSYSNTILINCCNSKRSSY